MLQGEHKSLNNNYQFYYVVTIVTFIDYMNLAKSFIGKQVYLRKITCLFSDYCFANKEDDRS